MKVGLYYYKNAMKDLSLIDRLQALLRESGFQTEIFTDPAAIRAIDGLIVLGGDGTVLSVAVVCGKQSIPILGINYGHLGFLTELDRLECLDVASLLKKNAFRKEKRSALKIKIGEEEFYALNEVAIQRQYNDRYRRQVISLQAEIDGKLIDRYVADGLIVCTPTGSTAYALSAGGAVLSPDLNAFMLTPICAHSLRSRPVVYSDQRKLTVSLSPEFAADVYCDGKKVGAVGENDRVFVEKADFSVIFMVRDQTNFYDKLFYKMNQWSGGETNGS
ncbi:MAG: NAD(+)/NADH kinase [Clostridia bacterium]|nr:NAD(+)/NADH kinase [Clostridia bacterium]